MWGKGEQVEGPDTAGSEHDEDEIWRDIVSRFDIPAEDVDDAEGPPWPAEENLDTQSLGIRVIKPADPHAVAGESEAPAAADGDGEHYVPPPPPPLPTLDPVAKGAWLALFGGPSYLLLTTVFGWTIPVWAAFGAVAAFVGGFITLVVRMSDDGRGDSGPDDGAVV